MREELYPKQALLSEGGRSALPSSLRSGDEVLFPMLANGENPNGLSDGVVMVEGVVRTCVPIGHHPSARGKEIYHVKVVVRAGGGFDAFETSRNFENSLDYGIRRL